MENNHKINLIRDFSLHRLLVLTLFIFMSSILICGLIYWQMNQIVKAQNEQIKVLSNQIDATSGKIQALTIE